MVSNVLISPLNFNCGYSLVLMSGYSLVLMSTHKIYFCREIEKISEPALWLSW